ncbi:helix-turn-helix domain-containing protein [Massilia sp. G4R7]|uniref:Helix-turn-helix domain-containing protein n=1 Tax=Massilia phyllostachyos TaxID=2898585 RepID=A0ABS8QBC4_9BURK|nr:helix-turn-helix transcriptional regulator [Massilia phyllostachyos]MCD2518251.1 helix-turn-helix domain-containing protein [Massilia phyllostachyos]
MNFGERLRQVRTDKGLTQPQCAQMAGIEQSYLSKLENGKSVPSAEMFSTILAGIGMDEKTFLADVDREVLETTLRHIPAVSQFTTQVAVAQVNHGKRWLFGSAACWVLGFAMMLAANDGIFFSQWRYHYDSPGVIRAGEADNIFSTHREIVTLRQAAKVITDEEASRELADFESTRARPVSAEWPESRGAAYAEAADGGHRRFQLVRTEYVKAPGNVILNYLGGVVLFSGFVGLFIEWRLRRLKSKR